MRTRTIRSLAAGAAVILALAPAAGCGSDDAATPDTGVNVTVEGTEPPATDPTATAPATDPPATATATDPPDTDPPATAPATDPPATDPPATAPATDPPATTPPAANTLVNVYWAWTVGNVPGTAERIGAGARLVPGDTPVRNALEAMFAGPNTLESDIGMLSLVPPGTRVLGIAVDGTTATVDLSAEFEDTIGGTLAESMQLAQVVFTVTQFDGFDRVKFHIEGEPRDELLTHGFEVGDGLTRDDFGEIRALIMIEGPYPGQAVENPLVVRGESSTFEATISWTLTTGGGDGLVVADGFATAGGSFGTFAPFEFEIDLAAYPATYMPGSGSIILFESSPQDGSPTWIVEIPIVLPDL